MNRICAAYRDQFQVEISSSCTLYKQTVAQPCAKKSYKKRDRPERSGPGSSPRQIAISRAVSLSISVVAINEKTEQVL